MDGADSGSSAAAYRPGSSNVLPDVCFILWLPPAEWESFPSGWHCPLCDRRLINTIAWTPLSLSLSFLIPQEDGVASLLHKLGGNKWDAQEQLLPPPHL